MSNEVFNLLEGSIVQVKAANPKGKRTKKEVKPAPEPDEPTNEEPGMVLPEPGAIPPSPFPPKDKEARKQWEKEWQRIYENNLFYNEACWQEVVF